MSARARFHALFGALDEASEQELDRRLDAYRAEVITKAVSRLRAVPVTCTALTGPVWYGDGWNAAITTFEEIADYQKPDDEAYPGELQKLRALNVGLRAALLRRDDVEWARQQLVSLAEHEARERAGEADPEFFRPDRTYLSPYSRFQCIKVGRHPATRERRAVGWWAARESGGWEIRDLNPDDHLFGGWRDVTDEQVAP